MEQVQLSKASLSSSSGMSRVEMEAWVKESYDGVKTIHCKSEADQQLYIDSWGNVWPCCWTGNLGLKRASFMDREIFHKLVLNEYEKEFNNLNIKSLDEILEHSFFKHDLKDTWFRHNSGVGNCDSPACLKHCGKAD